MALRPDQELSFDEDDLAPVEALIAELRAEASGWINFVPEVAEGEDPPPRSIVSSVFTAKGPSVPMATWSAPAEPGQRASLGIEHPSGPQALRRLTEHQLALPEGWLKVADHPKRGLVVTSPANADPGDELWWLLSATHVLSTVGLTGSWLARVYRP